MSDCSLLQSVFEYQSKLCIYNVIWLIHGCWNCCCLGAHCVYTMQQLSTMVYSVPSCKVILHRVHVCLALTCHLCFGHNVQDLLHATVVTWGRNRHQNGSQHGKLTPEKKILLPLSQICFKPRGKTVQNEQRWWLFPGWPWNVMINLPFPPWAGSRNSPHLTASMFSYVTLTHIQHHQGQTIH